MFNRGLKLQPITDAKATPDAPAVQNACLKTDGKYADDSSCLVLEAY